MVIFLKQVFIPLRNNDGIMFETAFERGFYSLKQVFVPLRNYDGIVFETAFGTGFYSSLKY